MNPLTNYMAKEGRTNTHAIIKLITITGCIHHVMKSDKSAYDIHCSPSKDHIHVNSQPGGRHIYKHILFWKSNL